MLADIEDAMIAAVKAKQDDGTLGYKYKTLKSYGGEFAAGIERAITSFPACLFLYEGGGITKIGQNWKITCRWVVAHGAGNLRNEKAARHGDGSPGNVGSYQMVIDTIKILAGQKLGLEIDQIMPTAVVPLVNDGAGSQLASAYAVRLETAFITDTLPEIGTLDKFITAHTDWDIPVFGNVDRNIPSDDTADATDIVTLEQ